METVGQLAGGIAHDFNNMLTVINGHAGLLLDSGGLPSEVTESLKQIYMAGERASNLTRQLLFFSRKRAIQRRSLELNLIVDEVAAMLRRLIGEDITLELKLDPALPAVDADAGMLEQVLINLAINARDAMAHGGPIKIHTRAVDRAATDIPVNCAAQPGRFACIMVQDVGCGIPPDVIGRIFEPFFTTKELGKGTGLGLATVFGIVQQHGGWIEVDSQVGVGTRFNIYLPAAPRSATPKAEDAGTKVKGGRETVLVVEDEEGVREFTVSVLRLYGYRVLQAHSGVDALEVWLRHSARIDLLLTDMVMPDDMSGPQLAARLRAEKPELPVVFASGYSQELANQVFAACPSAQFIHKPYQPRALAKIVREALDAKSVVA
jgi:CheY-like chemotaxis protein